MSRKLHILLLVLLSVLSGLMVVLTIFQAMDFNNNYGRNQGFNYYGQVSSGNHRSIALQGIKPYRSVNRSRHRIDNHVMPGSFLESGSIKFETDNKFQSNVITSTGVQPFSPVSPKVGRATSPTLFGGTSGISLNIRSGSGQRGADDAALALNTTKSSFRASSGQNITPGHYSSDSPQLNSMFSESSPLGLDPGGDPNDPGEIIGGLSVPDGIAYLLFLLLIYIAMKMTKAMALKKQNH